MIELKVERMTCGGYAASVRAAVLEVAPMARIEIEIDSGIMRVEGEAGESAVRSAIERAGCSIA